jgi:GNAT superfamily N-acetyltransferase
LPAPNAWTHIAFTWDENTGVRLYVNGKLAAFEAGFPRRVLLNGRERSFLCLTFLTTSQNFQGRGYGSQVKMELLRRARKHGFYGALAFYADGTSMGAGAQRAGAYVSRVFRVNYLAKLLGPVSGEDAAPISNIVDLFLKAADKINETVPFIRRWSREEAEWQCRLRSGGLCSSLQRESHCGVLTGYVVSARDSKVFLMEDLLWDALQKDERLDLLQDLLSRAAAAGARMAIAPVMGYTETDTLRQAGFRQTRRVMNMHLMTWNETPIEPLSSAYVDVF